MLLVYNTVFLTLVLNLQACKVSTWYSIEASGEIFTLKGSTDMIAFQSFYCIIFISNEDYQNHYV